MPKHGILSCLGGGALYLLGWFCDRLVVAIRGKVFSETPINCEISGLQGVVVEQRDSDHNCQLVTESGKKFSVRLPELDGTTCLASNQGWLLLFKKQGLEGEAVGNCGGSSSLFFFRPFSKTKIDLPGCPFLELSDHVAAFSCVPTSRDCTVSVINRVNDYEPKLHLLRRGAKEWFQYDIPCSGFSTINCAVYHTQKQELYFFDRRDCVLIIVSTIS
ncbi:unnamed protein product [Prunus armeniaca]|uniref:KIB1-4 beta-propeller domain-containing protein n=1 Tax=Prunus armeniaca TaxID=36596 RepID=A0A6J5VS47_PRUAR|nr:unnamed protein product [Prunus armeniaca]CAB4322071.1 unnamed protein product [Prunus armeniaca]